MRIVGKFKAVVLSVSILALSACNGQNEPAPAAQPQVSRPATVPSSPAIVSPPPVAVVSPTPRVLPMPTTRSANCSVGEVRDTHGLSSNEISGASTGIFVRETSCPGYKEIKTEVTLPEYVTSPARTEQPWVYFGMNDGATDIELGFSFQMGSIAEGIPPRWLAYGRIGKKFTYDRAHPIALGSTVEAVAYYQGGAGHLMVNGREALQVAVDFDERNLQIRRVTGIAIQAENFSPRLYTDLTLQNVVWQNTQFKTLSGEVTDFEKTPLESIHRDGRLDGTIWWPSERVSYQAYGDHEVISLMPEPLQDIY